VPWSTACALLVLVGCQGPARRAVPAPDAALREAYIEILGPG